MAAVVDGAKRFQNVFPPPSKFPWAALASTEKAPVGADTLWSIILKNFRLSSYTPLFPPEESWSSSLVYVLTRFPCGMAPVSRAEFLGLGVIWGLGGLCFPSETVTDSTQCFTGQSGPDNTVGQGL